MTRDKPDTALAAVEALLERARDGKLKPFENARVFDALTNIRAEHFPRLVELATWAARGPCLCHPANKAEGATCLKDAADDLLDTIKRQTTEALG